MDRYYTDRLAAERLLRCYELAPPRARAYLDSEIAHVAAHVQADTCLLELGCGYGRVLEPLADRARSAVGIDNSPASIALARRRVAGRPGCHLALMDATALGFRERAFDLVACIQNGISAFHVDPRHLLAEAVRVTRAGGTLLFSSYAAGFWDARLEWFRVQAAHGLLGQIDEGATGNGVIVCKDGFTATTFGPDDFRALTAHLAADVSIYEVAAASLVCEIRLR